MLAKDSPCAKSKGDSSAPAQSKPVATVIAKAWLVGAPRAVALNAFGLELADGTQLYVEQPAPVADRLIERLAQRFPDLENMYTAEVFADWLRTELNTK
ncbi:hypothetical protein [Pseudomonas sp. L13]|uniref:hypothetical protein n=1 Tax=Pseudomonas sp. L13 TaxID=343985 RepID=UPI00137A201E|nr:hypothetical protein [Pseudomonas sp. L13]NCE90967.1 hypothetical protein [Pseudomonas sp. L13]